MHLALFSVAAFVAVAAVAAPTVSDVEDQRILDIDRTHVKASANAPPIPSIEEIKQHMHDRDYVANKSLFYEGPDWEFFEGVMKYEKQHSRYILGSFWLDNGRSWFRQWEDMTEFWDRASTAMAELSSMEALVLLPSDTNGTEWKRGTFWDRIEWPVLTERNPAITKIIRVSLENDRHEVIYEKQEGVDNILP